MNSSRRLSAALAISAASAENGLAGQSSPVWQAVTTCIGTKRSSNLSPFATPARFYFSTVNSTSVDSLKL
jgi:hypothetical protein